MTGPYSHHVPAEDTGAAGLRLQHSVPLPQNRPAVQYFPGWDRGAPEAGDEPAHLPAGRVRQEGGDIGASAGCAQSAGHGDLRGDLGLGVLQDC